MASTGGNLLQRTRCFYFYDAVTPCNKRQPGSGCSAINGINRINAILGTSEACIATHPSDMCVALAALEAIVHVAGPAGARTIAFADFHRLPGDTPQRDTNLEPDEIITAIELPPKGFSANYSYLKIRDRLSYAFALVSVAAALELEGDTIKEARLALGGVAHKPWRDPAAEAALRGQRVGAERIRASRRPAAAGRQGLRAQRLQDRAGAARHRADAEPGRARHAAIAIRQEDPVSAMASYIGTATSRVDGRAKVTGEARYAGEFNVPGLVHGYVVGSTIPRGSHRPHRCQRKHCASPASSTSSPISIGRRCPTATTPTRTTSHRRRDRPIARFTTTGSCSTDSRSRWCWPRIGKRRVSPLRWCGSNTGKSRTSPICKRSATRPSSSKSPRSRAAMPRRRSRRPIRATRPSISSRPSTTIRWNCSPRRRSGTTASSRSTTRRKACRTCSNIFAACSRCSRTRSTSCRPIWAAVSAQACARNTRWCWRCWGRAR